MLSQGFGLELMQVAASLNISAYKSLPMCLEHSDFDLWTCLGTRATSPRGSQSISFGPHTLRHVHEVMEFSRLTWRLIVPATGSLVL